MPRNKEFKFPVTVLIGSEIDNLRKISRNTHIDTGFLNKYRATMAVSAILTAFSRFESSWNAKQLEKVQITKAPIFIVAFWRSGTTLLHNLLCQNPEFAFVSTFQTVFPNHTLSNQWWLKHVASPFLPEYRPADKVKFEWENPQEEELALGNMQETSFYNFMYFPNDFKEYVEKGLLIDGLSDDELKTWEDAYCRLIKTALINSGGNRFISKNPPNAFRIKQFLKMFPDAKFINITRNKDEVIFSFKRFMIEVLKGTALQDFEPDMIDKRTRELYALYLERYNADKHLIPKGNLVEIDYHEFVDHKIEGIKHVYESLNLDGFEASLPNIEQYLEETKDFQPWNHRKMQKIKH
ncbi:MAG: sulfotransferase [Bacteroidales bacterium]|jgi:hypothetical protein|nr:sulfotransferase [Bacteroidales bacterium]